MMIIIKSQSQHEQKTSIQKTRDPWQKVIMVWNLGPKNKKDYRERDHPKSVCTACGTCIQNAVEYAYPPLGNANPHAWACFYRVGEWMCPGSQSLANHILQSDCLQQHKYRRQLSPTKNIQTARSRGNGWHGSRQFRSPFGQEYEA